MTRAKLNAGGWGEYVCVGDTEIFFFALSKLGEEKVKISVKKKSFK